MASIKLGALVADIKGKLAGNYFAKRKNTTVLAVCGSKLTKADAGRTALQVARNSLSGVARKWQQLTAAQRLTWEAQAALLTWYTKVGVPYTPSGYQLFSQNNLNRLKIGLDFLINYAEPTPPADVNNVKIEIKGGGDIQYSYDGTLSGNKYVVVYASFTNSIGVKYPKAGLKTIAVVGADVTADTDITDGYVNAYGGKPLSGMVFFKAELIDGASGIQEGSKLTKADAGLV